MIETLTPRSNQVGSFHAEKRDNGSSISLTQTTAREFSICPCCGEEVYNEPSIFDEAECESRGRADRANGVNPMDGPYVAGLPFYAWERGYYANA